MNENTCMSCGCTNERLFEVRINGEVKRLCADCLEAEGFIRCSDCGRWVRLEDAVTVDRGYNNEHTVCRSCAEGRYLRCPDCGEYITGWNASRTSDEGILCDRCAQSSDRWSYCSNCGRYFPAGEAHRNPNTGESCCERCYNTLRLRTFHDYGYKPVPDFKYRTSETHKPELVEKILTFGLELEVDDGDDHRELSDDLAALELPIYMKHDGSLGDEGVEIVTHPCSLAYHRFNMRWAEISRICRKHHYTSHEAGTCGLHIHIGRKQMGDSYESREATAANLVLLVYHLWNQMVRFSRRTESQLDDWAKCPDLEYYGFEDGTGYGNAELRSMALDTQRSGRYQAVNLCNSETVELRLFRGTLKRDTLIASVQLASNLTKYAMTHTPKECMESSWSDVIGVEQFKELNNYCEKMGIR